MPSLLVEIRRRMGAATFAHFHQAILNAMDAHVQRQSDGGYQQDPPHQGGHRQALETDTAPTADEDQGTVESVPTPQGKLILDATVVEIMGSPILPPQENQAEKGQILKAA